MNAERLGDPRIEQYLATKDVVLLGTVSPSGAPLVTPMWFLHDAEALTMISVDGLPKVRNLRREPRVCVVAESGTRRDIRNVTVHGHAVFLAEPRNAGLSPSASMPSIGQTSRRRGAVRPCRPTASCSASHPSGCAAGASNHDPSVRVLAVQPRLSARRLRAGQARRATPTALGQWLIIHDQNLWSCPARAKVRLPAGDMPAGLPGASEPLLLGTYRGTPCWVTQLPREAPVPDGLRRETLIPMRGARLPDDLLSLGGMAMQALWWESTSGHCPRCGTPTARIPGEWGKKCPACQYEHYPHLHPAVIVLVRDGDRCLLARKRELGPRALRAGGGLRRQRRVLEGAVGREVKEEVGVDVKDIRYVGSQNWPFPSQLMVGFVASYAGGEVRIDAEELEDARWFPCGQLPTGPGRHSIARYIIDNYAQP